MFGLSEQQMNVIRHYYVPINAEIKTNSDTLQRSFERLPACVRRKQRTAMIAAERDEMALSGFLKAFQTSRHGVQLTLGGVTH
jgi:hypothetical protein